jgi:RecJ-like exonuclease
MGEIKNSLEEQIKFVAQKFKETTKGKEVQVISHFDTDGISSAAIIIKTLKRLDIFFSIKILKSLDEQFIRDLPKDKITLFLDLASGSLNHIDQSNLTNVFIIDHHEIIQDIPKNVEIINPELHDKQKISSSSLVFLFAKELDKKNSEMAKLAILGMVGDMLEKQIDKLNNGILEDGEIKRKRGLLIYPSTRPLNRTLEFSSQPYVPGVTGNIEGVIELLREAGIDSKNGKYKSIIELNEDEMGKIITAIMLRNPRCRPSEIVGDIFLIKLYNKLEDAREISAIVNACSRYGDPGSAIQFLIETPNAKKKAESIHIKYKQHLLSSLKFVANAEKIEGNGFVIINAKEKIKDTMIGTVASILQNSSLYEEGTIIIAMSTYEDKIKISGRNVGRIGRNVREILNKIVEEIGGEVGGHEFAAGCNIAQEKEEEFLNLLKKNLEIEFVKV